MLDMCLCFVSLSGSPAVIYLPRLDVLVCDSNGRPCLVLGPNLRRVPPTADYCCLSTVVAGGVYLPPVTPRPFFYRDPFILLYFCLFVCLAGANPAMSPSA